MENKVIATNKTAFHRYDIIDKLEAGIELKGPEVKSLRGNKADLRDSFARIDSGELYIHNLYISPYDKSSYDNLESRRVRKLLVHRAQIDKMLGKISKKGLTIVPLRLYFNNTGKAKVELAIAKGRKLYDQREKLKKKEVEVQIKKVQSFRNSL